MFPFDLPGPQFLLFYAVLALGVNIGLRRYLRGDPYRAVSLTRLAEDPYRVACLRAGVDESIRLAVVSLVDRGLLVLTDVGHLRASDATAASLVRRPIEQALLRMFARGRPADDALADPQVRREAETGRTALEQGGLVDGDESRGRCRRAALVACALLAGVAGAKIAIALAQGRGNVVFLLLMAIVAVFAALAVCWRTRTPLGTRVLESLQAMFRRARAQADRLRPGGASNEAALLAAVFGLSVLPPAAFPFVDRLYPRSSGDGGAGGGGADSGGSGCGGGGGCGGCGGGD